ncbi:MAG: DUF5107 domain-containing protein [Chitinophagaceae bacterium]
MKPFICCLIILTGLQVTAQNASFKIYNKTFTTYPFSDPNPIPNPEAAIYPYYHFDGYTIKPIQKEWKVVELENDFIKVMILPEIGGKVWAAIEKKTGKAFIYYNHVVKFRDVAMRGAWTSGGIESNFGTIGHTPNCSTPVDYTVIKKSDGSVSCITGALDLLTRTPWRIDINLPADKAYFTTQSFWFNASGIEEPYYHWMNAGIKVSGNLEYIYPGTKFIGHEGENGEWPINTKNKKEITWYKNNDFGGYKSYHVFGKYTNFFGGYWHDDNYGVVRFSAHDDKPGKKLWIWGLSRQGMIWENLMTDNDGQYTEIQSGRLFNQSAEGSALTPFKHRGFAPYATDSWTEYWYPVMNSKGYLFANEFAALNVVRKKQQVNIYLSPVQYVNDTLTIIQNGNTVFNKPVSLTPLKVFADSLRLTDTVGKITVRLGEHIYWQQDDTTDNINRPSVLPADFDQSSAYALYLQGKNSIYFRQYQKAAEKLKACLAIDKYFVPALTDMSMLMYRRMQLNDALQYAKTALSINTYEPAANYYYGLINKKLGNKTDAIDGFDIASQSEEHRNAAFTELAKMYFLATDTGNRKAIHYAEKALVYNQQNTDALQILAIAYRKQNNAAAANNILKRIEAIDPLSSFVKFENWLLNKDAASQQAFISLLQNEMPEQTCLELGLWYYNIGLVEEAKKLLQLSAPCAEVDYWLAYLHKNSPEEQYWYEKAKADKKQTAFPFRTESIEALQLFTKKAKDWQPVYNLALIEASIGNIEHARQLLVNCGDKPDDANFYACRANLTEQNSPAKEKDIIKALSLDGKQWRLHKQLADLYIAQEKYTTALPVVQNYYRQNPSNYIMGMLLAKTYLLNKQYKDAAAILDTIVIIPYEGATDGRRLYKETHLMLAIEAMQEKNYKKAVTQISYAREWPERLGAGKPYKEDIDERLENFLLYQAYAKQNDKKNAAIAKQSIINNTAAIYKSNALLTDWANGKTDALNKVNELTIADENTGILKEWVKIKN